MIFTDICILCKKESINPLIPSNPLRMEHLDDDQMEYFLILLNKHIKKRDDLKYGIFPI